MSQTSTEEVVERKALRKSVINKTYILDRVKKLMLLPEVIIHRLR